MKSEERQESRTMYGTRDDNRLSLAWSGQFMKTSRIAPWCIRVKYKYIYLLHLWHGPSTQPSFYCIPSSAHCVTLRQSDKSLNSLSIFTDQKLTIGMFIRYILLNITEKSYYPHTNSSPRLKPSSVLGCVTFIPVISLPQQKCFLHCSVLLTLWTTENIFIWTKTLEFF